MSEKFEANTDWKAKYGALLQNIGFDPQASEPSRKHPRIPVAPPDNIFLVQVGSIPGVLNDISAGGLSFLSKASMTTGRLFNLTFDNKFRGRVKVISSSLEGTNISGESGLFRTGTQFVTDEDGYRCTVQTLRYLSRVARL